MVETFKEIFRYRGLVWALVVRHLSVRYRGSVLGFLWTLLNPLLLMSIYTLVFQFFMRATAVEHYSIFVFCGLLPWLWVTTSLSEATSSIVASSQLVTKSMFPAHLLPLVAVLTAGINFLLALPLLAIFLVAAHIEPHWSMISLPVLIILEFVFLYGFAMMVSSLNVLYRDVQHIVSNILTFIFFLSPIVYPMTNIPERFRYLLPGNPFALFTVGFQESILYGNFPSLDVWLGAIIWATISIVIGVAIYRYHHESFAEVL